MTGWGLIGAALVLGIAVALACGIWAGRNDLSETERGRRMSAMASDHLDQTIDDLAAGRHFTAAEQDDRDAAWATRYAAATARDQPDSWPADHPILSGLLAAAAVLIIARVLTFMDRLESASAAGYR